MYRRLFFCFLFMCAAISRPAPGHAVEIPAAQNNQQQTAVVLKFGISDLAIAKLFGCDNFAWGSFTQNGVMMLEYVPTGDSVNSWTQMVTVTMYPLPAETDAQIDTMQTMEGKMLQAYAKGKIFDQQTYTDAKGYPRIYIEYEIGDGIQKEHNAGTLMRAGPALAAFIQTQTRGVPFDEAKAANMKLIAEGKPPVTTPN